MNEIQKTEECSEADDVEIADEKNNKIQGDEVKKEILEGWYNLLVVLLICSEAIQSYQQSNFYVIKFKLPLPKTNQT